MKRIVHYACIILFVCVFLWVISPMLRSNFFVTDDGGWMLIRLTAFAQALRDGQFPTRFLTRLNHGYGYPVSNFLYPGYLYLGSILKFLGFSYFASLKLVFIGSLLSGAIGMYYWTKIFTTKVNALCASIIFLLQPYLLFDIYKRGSVGEVLALCLFPWIFYFLSNNLLIFFSLSIGLLILSHNTLALFGLLLVAAYIVTQKKWSFLIGIVIGLCLSAFFWIPAFFELKYVKFQSTEVATANHYLADTRKLIFDSLASITLAVCGVAVSFIRKKNYQLGVLMLALLLLFIPLFDFFWNMSVVNRYIQFPFRLLSLIIILTSFYGCIFIDYVKKLSVLWFVVAFTIQLFFTAKYLSEVKNSSENIGYYATNESSTTVQNEYMPTWVIREPIEHPKTLLESLHDLDTITVLNQNSHSIEASIQTQTNSTIQANIIYYPGWKVVVNNIPVPINYLQSNGVMQFAVQSGISHVVLQFQETPLRKIANLISVMSLAIVGLYSISTKRNSI